LTAGEEPTIDEQPDHGAIVVVESSLLGDPAADRLGVRHPKEPLPKAYQL
jgi:hypothetical protein